MFVGDPKLFAIESGITKAYERLSFRALGYFNIHIVGRQYGVSAPDATMLGCSFDEIERRIAQRGKHTAPFSANSDAGKIADAFRDAIYAPDQEANYFFGIPHSEFRALISSNRIKWAPDGDEAFDDGSFILQFDVESRVRLIGFSSLPADCRHDLRTLTDVWLDAELFYATLQQWRDAFHLEWRRSSKIPECADGASR